jgi:NADH-quinone oxidoreductase subunit I
MSAITDTLRALRTTLVNALRRPVTVQFPDVIRPRADRYRASFALPNDEHGELACIGCLACERICPSRVIRMKTAPKRESPVTGKKRAYVDEFVLDLTGCIQCELCVQVCNSDAITMVREPETPVFTREDLVLDLVRLRANAESKTASWGRGTVLQDMQEPPKPKVPKADKPGAPTKPAKVDKPDAPTKPEPAPAEPKVEPIAALVAAAPDALVDAAKGPA